MVEKKKLCLLHYTYIYIDFTVVSYLYFGGNVSLLSYVHITIWYRLLYLLYIWFSEIVHKKKRIIISLPCVTDVCSFFFFWLISRIVNKVYLVTKLRYKRFKSKQYYYVKHFTPYWYTLYCMGFLIRSLFSYVFYAERVSRGHN